MFALRLMPVFGALAHLGLALTGPTTVLEYKEWKSIECQVDSTSARTLKHLVAVASPNMTVESCLDSCAAGGYILAGVEFGDECYCGNALLYGYGTSQMCDMPCSGNTSEFCGGPKALNLYQFADTPFTTGPASTKLTYKNWVWWGCMDELWPLGPRLLPHGPLVPIAAEQMTVERCLDGCAAAGYNAAALEAGQECSRLQFLLVTRDCDLIPPLDGLLQPLGWESTNTFECADPCLANATEVCGGLIPHFLDGSATTEGRLWAYLACELQDRCDQLGDQI
ncbi:WSC domain-containing protein [Mycena olivaceomarginata]|nr:WSC domain-containing protein [Mycena olivaceomarginata]